MKDQNYNLFEQLNKEWAAVWRKLDNYTKGSGPNYGWDMPTMEVVMPECAAELKRLKQELRKEHMLLKSAGLLPK